MKVGAALIMESRRTESTKQRVRRWDSPPLKHLSVVW